MKENFNLNKNDLIAASIKSTIGALPGIGPLFSEIICFHIPNQRIDRVELMLKELSEKISDLDLKDIQNKVENPEIIDLVEEGITQSMRAISDERIVCIASLLKNSLSGEQISYANKMRFFTILKELNDIEIIIMMYPDLCNQGGNRNKFYSKHKLILQHPDIKNRKAIALYQSHRDHLQQLKLCRQTYDLINEPTPEFDSNTGKLKGTGFMITDLGRLFLESIDRAHPLHPNAKNNYL